MTSELCDDLIKFSFNNLHDVMKHDHTGEFSSIHLFVPRLLVAVKQLVCLYFHLCILYIFTYSTTQPLSEANALCHTLQVDLDKVLCDVLEKYQSFPGFALLLGSLLWYTSSYKLQDSTMLIFPSGMVAFFYMVRQKGEGHILDDIGLSRYISTGSCEIGTLEFLPYLSELLENTERSGTSFFDQQKYTIASKECLQLYLCSHHNFSKKAPESSQGDKALRRSKPWAWISRLGVHSRIWKARNHVKIQQRKHLSDLTTHQIRQHAASFIRNPSEHEYQSLAYQWALDLLPFLLERSAVSLELADVLHNCTFTTMAQKFPRSTRLAKAAINKYLLQVEESAGSDS